MRRRHVVIAIGAAAAVAAACAFPACGSGTEMPFGGPADVGFAERLWTAMEGYEAWPMSSGVYPGASPHGRFLMLHYNMVIIDGAAYHTIVKDNFGGEGATLETVAESPADHIAAVTVMLQREPGYDEEFMNWFWVKYAPDGTIDRGDDGTLLAGRVAKGTDAGCIACHATAKDGDFLFTNDR